MSDNPDLLPELEGYFASLPGPEQDQLLSEHGERGGLVRWLASLVAEGKVVEIRDGVTPVPGQLALSPGAYAVARELARQGPGPAAPPEPARQPRLDPRDVRLQVTPGCDFERYLDGRDRSAATPGRRALPPLPPLDPSRPSAIQADGHVSPAAAARWHQAQTELVGLIKAENRTLAADPHAEPLVPGSDADWLASRVAELEREEPEAG